MIHYKSAAIGDSSNIAFINFYVVVFVFQSSNLITTELMIWYLFSSMSSKSRPKSFGKGLLAEGKKSNGSTDKETEKKLLGTTSFFQRVLTKIDSKEEV